MSAAQLSTARTRSRGRSRTGTMAAPHRCLRGADRRRAGDDDPVLLDAAHLAQDAGRGVRRRRRCRSRPAPTGRTTSGCGTRSGTSRSATFFLNSLKIATLSTIGEVFACSLAAFAFAVHPVPRPAAAVRAADGDPDHPVPGRPRAQLHPVADAAQPVQRLGQLHRHPGAAVAGGVPRRRVRDLPAPPVLPRDPGRARRRGAGGRREPVADLPPHLHAAGPARARHAGDLHLHVVVERPADPADLPARPRPVHDDRRASRSSRASSWASGRR